MSYKKAFTIVEVLVVTVAIGILTIILTISYSTYLSTAKTAASKANATTIQQIAESIGSEVGSYPDTIGKFKLGTKSVNLPKNLDVIADADETTLNSTNGANTIAYACLDSCIIKKILGGRITYWDFVEKAPKYIFLGDAKADSSFDYPPVMTAIYSGDQTNCATTNTTSTYCWGFGGKGQYGNSKEGEEFSTYPTPMYMKGVLAGKTMKQIVNADEHSCGIASDNYVYCWGSNIFGQIGDGTHNNTEAAVAVSRSGVLSGKTINSIASMISHTCVVASDQKAYCWGSGDYGSLGNNSDSNSNIPVAVYSSGVLSGKSIKNIATGWDHTCAVSTDGLGYCWGRGSSGELGNGSNGDSSVPVLVNMTGALSGKTISSVSVGSGFSCALVSDNKVYCWGYNGNGQLGDTTTANKNTPVAVYPAGQMSGKTVKTLSSSSSASCVIGSDDKVYCWGYNTYGQIGDNTYNSALEPKSVHSVGGLVGKTVKKISAGLFSACAITSNDSTYCWGRNLYSGISLSASKQNSPIPVIVSGSGSLSRLKSVEVTAGHNNGCIIASDGNAYCWGKNDYGQLGTNNSPNKKIPTVAIGGLLKGKTLNTLMVHNQMCATNSLNVPYCWGDNANGQVGIGNSGGAFTPNAVNTSGALSGKTINKFSSGLFFTCAIASDNNAYCWGYNNGHFGNNSTVTNYSPTPVYTAGVLSGKTIKDIQSGNYNTCVIASDDQAYCWGTQNDYGQLGNNTTDSTLAPVAVYTSGVLNGKTIKKLTVGYGHACVIASDNLAYCWGDNYDGQLGDGTNDDSSQPVQVSMTGALSGKTFKSIQASDYATCAIASDDKVYCWGYNGDGELGINSYDPVSIPTAIYQSGPLNNKSIKSISAGESHFCVLTTTSEPYCWGWNAYGQLGDNTTKTSPVPVRVIY